MTPTPSSLDGRLNRRLALGGVVAAAAVELASHQGRAFAAAQEHPLAGTWFLDSSSENPTAARDLFILHADGSYIKANADGSVRLGAWNATGPTTATLTIVSGDRDETGANAGGTTLRLSLTLNPDGNGYTAVGTIDRTNRDGPLSGQAGPVTGTATRFVVEAPDPPVMTLAQLFGGTAEATPAP